MNTTGIYIHIPFCKSKCIYCDFYSVAGQNDRIEYFVNAITSEIETCPVDTTEWTFGTIFIGGGTPSLLNAQQIEKIISTLNNKYDLRNIKEFTIEANPGEAPKEKLKDFFSLGINRLSIGVQSFKPKLLHFLSRIHSSENVFRTFQSARAAGFNNINCDLIYNIPEQSLEDWQDDINTLIDLSAEHISAYSLTVEQNTKLHELVHNKTIIMPVDELHQQFNAITYSTLQNNNYAQYEISNYSKYNKECLHNLHYWENDFYLGFGPSAHSYDGKKRWNNFSNLDKYITVLKDGKLPIESFDDITAVDKINEIIGFGLRMTKGFKISRIHSNLLNQFQKQLKQAQIKFPQMIIEDKNRIKLNQTGINFADAIAAELLLS
ncbi:MAG: radical SAM family heme chaperone HemW [Candidatus Marinimicrobia bacterium]|nr:radical SAM family heme chaperone HemW [Candidatus Neomarinimicrobiota bacterium]